MKIVCLLGSPNAEGNSAALARRFCDTAESMGAAMETFSLNKLRYRGCQACMACKTRLDKCALSDDLSPVLDAVAEADILVLASPVYYGEVCSQMKAFIDRTFCFLTPEFKTNPAAGSRLQPNKKLVFIQVQTEKDPEKFSDIYPRYQFFFNWYGFTESHLIRACGVVAPGDVKAQEEVMALAEKTARLLVG